MMNASTFTSVCPYIPRLFAVKPYAFEYPRGRWMGWRLGKNDNSHGGSKTKLSDLRIGIGSKVVSWKMASSTSVSEFRSGLDDFLYASIDEGENGRLLSVLSMLARLNVDPWQEAANLARMPRENAVQRLTSLIAALPGGPSAHQDTNAVAIRLITLLPHDGSSNSASREILSGIGVPCNLRALVYVIVINLIFVAIAFGSHYLLVGTQSPARSEHAHVPVTGEGTSKAPSSIK